MLRLCGPECFQCGCGRGEGPCVLEANKIRGLKKAGLWSPPRPMQPRRNKKAEQKKKKAKRKKGRR